MSKKRTVEQGASTIQNKKEKNIHEYISSISVEISSDTKNQLADLVHIAYRQKQGIINDKWLNYRREAVSKFLEGVPHNSKLNKEINQFKDTITASFQEYLNKQKFSYTQKQNYKEAITSSLNDLTNVSYKTRFVHNIDNIVQKVERNLQLLSDDLTIDPKEKLSSSEIGMLSDLQKASYALSNWEKQGLINNEGSLHDLYQKSQKSSAVINQLNQEITKRFDFQSGDIAMEHGKRSKAAHNRRGDGIESKLTGYVSKYEHAAQIYMKKDTAYLSHVYGKYTNAPLNLFDNVGSDIFRVDPLKLIPRKYQPKLEKKLGQNWKEKIADQFHQIVQTLHQDSEFQISNNKSRRIAAGLADYNLAVKIKDSTESSVHTEQPTPFIAKLLNNITNTKIFEKITGTTAAKEGASFGIGSHQANKEKDFNLVHYEMYPRKKDFNLDNDMFQQEEAKTRGTMICSEFVTRSIIASLVELQSWIAEETGIEQESTINIPFDKNESLKRVHPQRLIELLDKAGCITKIENKALNSLINVEEYRRNFSPKENHEEILYKKMQQLAKEHKNDVEIFVQKGSDVFKAYINAIAPKQAKTPDELYKMLDSNLKELHKKYDERNPSDFIGSIKNMCRKVKEFLGISTNKAKAQLTHTMKDAGIFKNKVNSQKQKSSDGYER